jgi:hypothetical protein
MAAIRNVSTLYATCSFIWKPATLSPVPNIWTYVTDCYSFESAIQSFMLFHTHLSFTVHGHLPAVDKVHGVEIVKFIAHTVVTLRTILTQLKNYWYQSEKELKMRQLWPYAFICTERVSSGQRSSMPSTYP